MRPAPWGLGMRGLVATLAVVVVLLPGCRKRGWLDTYPVKGVILVDGKPAKDVKITFHPVQDMGDKPVIPSGSTNEQGEFQLSTFVTDDGAPAGEYDVTIVWPVRFNPISRLWEGDQLKGHYDKPDKAKMRITIEKKPQELSTIELSVNGPKK